MDLRLHRPGFPLSEYVESIWKVTNSGVPPSRQPVYPNGAMALMMHLDRPTACFFVDGKPCSVRVPLLAGPYSRLYHVDPSRTTAAVGILFRPGGARMFFPVAAHELHNADIALSELYPREADRLLNDVCSSIDVRAQFMFLEHYLSRSLPKALPMHPAIRYAVKQLPREGGVRSVGRIQSATGLSHTRFIQLFREYVGLTPKLYCRVTRFHALLDQIGKGVPANWAQLATDCGYFDQAHLIRDFRAFAGVTPLKYIRALPDPNVESLAMNIES